MHLNASLHSTMFRKVFSAFRGDRNHAEPLRVGGIFAKMTPEAMCEIDPETMDREDIRLQLAKLYKRHNHAAGSLKPELREEAKIMLDAIVHCRRKYVDEAGGDHGSNAGA